MSLSSVLTSLPDLEEDENVPVIHNVSELQKYIQPLYIIENYTESHKVYKEFMKQILNAVRGSFKIRKCREYPVKFKFYKSDKKTYTMQIRHFLVNAILWNPFVELNDMHVLNESYLFDGFNDVPEIEDYINYKLLTTLRDYNIKSTTINFISSEVLYNLRLIPIDFSLIMGLNFSALTFTELYENNKEMKEIMEVKFSDDMQPHEIEQQLSELQAREVEIFKNDPNNPIGVILTAKSGIKTKQLAEFTISEGLKPSLEGVTIPIPIENSTLLRGLDRPSYLFIDATGARKSLQGHDISYLLPLIA